MATLVLTAIGQTIAGPIGAVVGSIAGQAIDRNILFRPKGREGPRLTELSVQTSSYGSPIPKIFGAMRVAGTVIWSTDLIESKAKSSSGKGQPTVTNYSYSVSFAVLLSARAIGSVGRIWADGKLLRGAAGDFKTQTGFRLHPGGEDQPVDPLIAAAEGAGLAPAHRGCAYAVFEHFQLADYGNRIPSLTFEVIADPVPVAIGAVVADLTGGLVDAPGATPALAGFSAYGDSARGVLEMLALAGGAWFAPRDAGLVMRTDAAAVATIGDDGYAAGSSRGARRDRTVTAIETVPQTMTLAHYDPARDYQTGLQRARRPGAGTRHDRIDLPAAIDAGMAKAIVEASLVRAETGRERRKIAASWSALGIAPGAIVAVVGETGRWRVTGWSFEAKVLTLDLVRLADVAAAGSATAGRVLASPDTPHGPTIAHIFELPPLDDAVLAAPRLSIAAAGSSPGWRQAALLLSTDEGARWTAIGGTAGVATIGAVADAVAAGPATIRDLVTSIEIELAHADMALCGADDAAVDGGANLALIGNELLQFGTATPIGGGRWRIGRLLRGRRGTESAIGTQAPGDRFVLIEPDTIVTADVSLAALGTTVRLLASGVGDIEGPAAAATFVSGASVRPPAPVHVALYGVSDGAADGLGDGGASLRWARRSRAGWRWIDGADAPLAEEHEAYRVTIQAGIGAARTIETDAPVTTLAAADRIGGTQVTISQRGSNGESAIAMAAFA